jgi:hypothetical protein
MQRYPLRVIRDRVELAAGPAMSAMLRKRKQNQSIGICRDGPGFRVKPRARPWLRSRRARLGHLVVVDRRDGLSTSGGSGIEPGGVSLCNNALKTRLPRRGYASLSSGLRVALVGVTRRPRGATCVALVGATRRQRPLKSVSDRWRSVMTSKSLPARRGHKAPSRVPLVVVPLLPCNMESAVGVADFEHPIAENRPLAVPSI